MVTIHGEEFKSFYVLPPNDVPNLIQGTGEILPYRAWHVHAFHLLNSAEESRIRYNSHSTRLLWAEPLYLSGVKYKTNKPDILGTRSGCPSNMWILVDLCNGNFEIEEGSFYVFCFETRAQARDYYKMLAASRAKRGSIIIDTSQPFLVWQA